ncbi:PEPxxWA-CTERM sorting domain-containing protein [Sphingomonas sp. Tas61C01]|uniref:PEPxxWA-CTERM sorting domain-containing protein n=1 Tax=Sphingomonas sp. Tas61C01 TaxID=3458297 RepID=UPI00403EB7FD
MNRYLSMLVATAFAVPSMASAHTSSLGYVPGMTNGSVIFWTGSYEHGGGVSNEGTFTLQGITDPTYMAVVNANVAPTTVRPGGLIDGTNNFFWAEDGSGGYTFPSSIDPVIFGLGISHWQGISFSGLTAGDYSFTCGLTCGTTQQWETLTSGAVRITLTSGDIGGGIVPEPATWAMMLLGFGAIGVTMRRRVRQSVNFGTHTVAN